MEEAFVKFGSELLHHASVLVGPTHADDVVSEAIIGAIRSPKFDAAENQIGYLHRSVLNAARMMHRGRSRSAKREWTVTTHEPSASTSLLGRPEVVDAVRSLSLRQRSVIYLAYWEDLPIATIATTLAMSEGSAKKHLARARANLRSVLDA